VDGDLLFTPRLAGQKANLMPVRLGIALPWDPDQIVVAKRGKGTVSVIAIIQIGNWLNPHCSIIWMFGGKPVGTPLAAY
jgi:hypothetical protein